MYLKTKLPLIFVSLSILFVGVMGGVILEQVSTSFQKKLISEQIRNTETTSNVLKEFTNQLIDDSKLYFSLVDHHIHESMHKIGIKQFEENILIPNNEIKELFVDLLNHDKKIQQIRLINNNGNEIIRVNSVDGEITIVPKNELQNKSHRPYFVNAIQLEENEIHITKLELQEENEKVSIPHESTMRIATPIFHDDTKYGILIINYHVTDILKLIATPEIGKSIMVDNDGYFLVHPESEKTFAKQLGTDHNYFNEQPEVMENTKNLESKEHHDKEEKEFRLWQKIHYDPNNYDNYWVYFSIVTESELFEPIKELQDIIILSIIVTAIISMIVTVLFSIKTVYPINKLNKNIQQIDPKKVTQNKISQSLLESHDEVGTLANSFNKMISEIQKHNQLSEENKEKLQEALNEINVNKKLVENQLLELEKLDEAKDEFASMVSHELKTPLFPIKGYLEIFSDPDLTNNLTPDQQVCLDEISTNVERLEVLIADVIDTQKLALGKMSFNKTPFSVGEFLSGVLKDSTSLMIEKQIQMSIPPIEETSITTDKNRLHQVLDNLIRNAVDFVPEKEGKIEVRVNSEKNRLLFSVKDNGIGIPKDKQANLFKKFYQVDTSPTRQHGGTGLGLVICKGIVEGLGGKMWVESDGNGAGTTFYFTIPKN